MSALAFSYLAADDALLRRTAKLSWNPQRGRSTEENHWILTLIIHYRPGLP